MSCTNYSSPQPHTSLNFVLFTSVRERAQLLNGHNRGGLAAFFADDYDAQLLQEFPAAVPRRHERKVSVTVAA